MVQMTNTLVNTNNSGLQRVLREAKLTGPNFIDWYSSAVVSMLLSEILAGSYCWVTRIKRDCLASCFYDMVSQQSPKKSGKFSMLNDMLKELKLCLHQQESTELSIDYAGYIDNLERLGHPVTLGLAVSQILIGLHKEFDRFVQNYNMHSLGKTVNECLVAMLCLKINPKFAKEEKECSLLELVVVLSGFFSSIYTVSNKRAKIDLDSALLWHCGLRHISKKRIEKLQHDGLLNSTDLGAFEKCVPCMSLITSRQGARSKQRTKTMVHKVKLHQVPPKAHEVMRIEKDPHDGLPYPVVLAAS
ncbi:retrotransposon protein, putative, ty1-copia subclass [Tanacetum coccineum]